MSRRDKRSLGRRERKRISRAKSQEFHNLYSSGFGRSAIASMLGVDRPTVEKMFEAVEGNPPQDVTAPLGGGGVDGRAS